MCWSYVNCVEQVPADMRRSSQLPQQNISYGVENSLLATRNNTDSAESKKVVVSM